MFPLYPILLISGTLQDPAGPDVPSPLLPKQEE